MRALVAAITFLTRVPIPGHWDFDARDVGKGAKWFPLVGALIGLAYAAAVWAFSPFLPALVIGVIVVSLEAVLTGALHLDGLADTADGFGGGHTREDVLRIMRDHAIGSYGGVALVLLVCLKVTAIAGLLEQHRLGPYLILSPMLGRWSAVLLNCLLPYARRTIPEGGQPGGAVSDFVSWRELAVATLFSILVAVPVAGWLGIVCWVSVIALSAAAAVGFRHRIGGVTGDTLGANTEICEAIVLLVGLAMT